MSLTSRQREIVLFIAQKIRECGLPPTRMEICARFGFKSPNAAQCHIKALEAKGFIKLHADKSRGIQLLTFEGST